MSIEKHFYLPNELAAMLRVDVDTVRSWIRKGWVQGVRVGGVIRIPREAFLRAIEEGVEPNSRSPAAVR